MKQNENLAKLVNDIYWDFNNDLKTTLKNKELNIKPLKNSIAYFLNDGSNELTVDNLGHKWIENDNQLLKQKVKECDIAEEDASEIFKMVSKKWQSNLDYFLVYNKPKYTIEGFSLFLKSDYYSEQKDLIIYKS